MPPVRYPPSAPLPRGGRPAAWSAHLLRGALRRTRQDLGSRLPPARHLMGRYQQPRGHPLLRGHEGIPASSGRGHRGACVHGSSLNGATPRWFAASCHASIRRTAFFMASSTYARRHHSSATAPRVTHGAYRGTTGPGSERVTPPNNKMAKNRWVSGREVPDRETGAGYRWRESVRDVLNGPASACYSFPPN